MRKMLSYSRIYVSISFSCVLLSVILQGVKAADNDTVILNLEAGSPTFLSVVPGKKYEIVLNKIPDWAVFSLVQTHFYWYNNVTLSSTRPATYGSSKNGSNIGMVNLIGKRQTKMVWYVWSKWPRTVEGIIMVSLFQKNDPIPGGCNEEFNIPLDPTIYSWYKAHANRVVYQFGNIATERGGKEKDCEDETENWEGLKYAFYQYTLPSDLTEMHLMDEIKEMMKPEDVKRKAKLLFTTSRGKTHPVNRLFAVEDQPMLYSIIVTYKGRSVSYVPDVTYGCRAWEDGCSLGLNARVIIVALVTFLFGVFICFFGHRCFKTEMFIIGFLPFYLVTYILIAKFTYLAVTWQLVFGVFGGIIGGILWLSLWWFAGIAVISVLMVGFLLGYLFSCIMFYTPQFGNMSVWSNAFDYGMTFACGVLIIPVLLLAFPKKLNIIGGGILGGYGMVASLSVYTHATIHYIVLYNIFKAVIPNYMSVKIYPPFLKKDIVLCVVWGILAIVGMCFQFYRERNLPMFPESRRERMARLRAENAPEDDEHRGLLSPATAGRNSDTDPRQFRGYGATNTAILNATAPPMEKSPSPIV